MRKAAGGPTPGATVSSPGGGSVKVTLMAALSPYETAGSVHVLAAISSCEHRSPPVSVPMVRVGVKTLISEMTMSSPVAPFARSCEKSVHGGPGGTAAAQRDSACWLCGAPKGKKKEEAERERG